MSMIKRFKPGIAATAALLTLMSLPVLAEESTPVKLLTPVQSEEAEPQATAISVEGQLEWSELEGGFYSVNGWALMGDSARFAALKGQDVTVTGKVFDGFSTWMVKTIVVQGIEQKGEGPAPVRTAPGSISTAISLEGQVEYTDLEGGFYSLDGWGLIGNEALFQSLKGKQAIIRGEEFTGISFRQVKQIEVANVFLSITANRSLPQVVTVNKHPLAEGQGAKVIDGVLMLPLRAVVEAAGGSVTWDAEAQAVAVQMADRTAHFAIGQEKAEMNQHNVRYIQRNMIAMSKAPMLVDGRTMISADALTQILGLYEVADLDANLDLVPLQ